MSIFESKPRSLLRELIEFVLFAVVFVGIAVILDWNRFFIWTGFGAYVLGTAGRYLWWHFRPYREPAAHPVTRYSKAP